MKIEKIIYPLDSNGEERAWSLGQERAKTLVNIDLIARVDRDLVQVYRKYRQTKKEPYHILGGMTRNILLLKVGPEY